MMMSGIDGTLTSVEIDTFVAGIRSAIGTPYEVVRIEAEKRGTCWAIGFHRLNGTVDFYRAVTPEELAMIFEGSTDVPAPMESLCHPSGPDTIVRDQINEKKN